MSESNPNPTNESPEYRKRGRSKKPLVITLVLVIVAALVALGVIWMNRDTNAPGANGGPSEQPSGGEIAIGLTLEPSNLDIRTTGGVALDQILIDNVYQGLIGLAPNSLNEFVPVLAEDLPEVSDDALEYTFTLRDGVTFASGNPLTAADVVDSLSAAEGPASLGTALGAPVSVEAADDRTVSIKLSEPNSQLLWQLANRPGLIFESAYAGDLSNTANGTGPYALENWKQGDSITFVARPDYWGDAATLDRVIWRYIPDGNAAVNAALEGDLDVLAPVTQNLASQFDGTDFTLSNGDGTDVYTLGYNSQRAPLDDVRVRTALSKAIDSDAIIAAFYGAGKPLGGPITSLEPGYEDLTSINSYDPEGARALLAEAGIEDLALTVTFPNFYPADAINQVVTQFAEIGVTLTVDSVEFGTWLNDVYITKDFDLSYIDHAEASDFANYANPDYYFGYDNPEVQSLFAQSIAATDADEAAELLKQAARQVAEDAPAKWLINWTPTVAVNKSVSGFPGSNINSRINLAGVTVG